MGSSLPEEARFRLIKDFLSESRADDFARMIIQDLHLIVALPRHQSLNNSVRQSIQTAI
jgi:hypothetical protein